MSIKVQSWVYEHSEATGNERLILLAIADEADDDGTNACPGIDRIARKARVNKRTTMRCIERLEDAGRLVVHRPVVNGRGHFNTYVVVMTGDQKGDTLARGEMASHTPSKGDTKARKGAQPYLDRSRPIDPQTQDQDPPLPPEPSVALILVPDPLPAQAPGMTMEERVFEWWLDVTNRTGRTMLTPRRRRKIQWALANYSAEDIFDALCGWMHSPHHRGENAAGTVWNDLELLLRDGEHIEMFRDFQRNPPRPRRVGSQPVADSAAAYLASRRGGGT